jgi:hypothetical protein
MCDTIKSILDSSQIYGTPIPHLLHVINSTNSDFHLATNSLSFFLFIRKSKKKKNNK